MIDGITRLGLVVGLDALDSAPIGNNFAEFLMVNNGTNKPELSVEWVSRLGFPCPHFNVGDGHVLG